MTGEERRPVTGLSDEYFDRAVAPAPDLSPEQAEELRRILGGPIEELSGRKLARPARMPADRSAKAQPAVDAGIAGQREAGPAEVEVEVEIGHGQASHPGRATERRHQSAGSIVSEGRSTVRCMRMRTNRITFTVDAISQVTDIGELAKIAHLIGYDVTIAPADENYEEVGTAATFFREGLADADEDIVSLAIVSAVSQGLSGTQMVELLERELRARCFPMDKPLDDAFSLGQPPEDHAH
ncbi:hypothetical protein RB608_24825 [Nocardioides sp. LHD-245]|uniref:hypothetical protein n=1 Tax=Nocardioides sp. LHD-245 TaxID=3051387 RepID=UPI0027DF0018|nr:hypothetical protein [Nocardioides sp. LHD-245]